MEKNELNSLKYIPCNFHTYTVYSCYWFWLVLIVRELDFIPKIILKIHFIHIAFFIYFYCSVIQRLEGGRVQFFWKKASTSHLLSIRAKQEREGQKQRKNVQNIVMFLHFSKRAPVGCDRSSNIRSYLECI